MLKIFSKKDLLNWIKLYVIGLFICCSIEMAMFTTTNGDYNHDISRYVVIIVVVVLMAYFFKSDFIITRKKKVNEFISSLNTVRMKRVKK